MKCVYGQCLVQTGVQKSGTCGRDKNYGSPHIGICKNSEDGGIEFGTEDTESTLQTVTIDNEQVTPNRSMKEARGHSSMTKYERCFRFFEKSRLLDTMKKNFLEDVLD